MTLNARELAEIGHNAGNRYSYEGEWGIRRKSRSDKAWLENFVQESKETRAECVAAAIRDAVIEELIADYYGRAIDEDGLIFMGDDGHGVPSFATVPGWLSEFLPDTATVEPETAVQP